MVKKKEYGKVFSTSIIFLMVLSGLIVGINLPERTIPLKLSKNVSASFAGGDIKHELTHEVNNSRDIPFQFPDQRIEIDEYDFYDCFGDWSPDGTKIAFSALNSLRVWDVQDEEFIIERENYSYSLSEVSWSPDGMELLLGTSNNTAILIDSSSGDVNLVFEGHTSYVEFVDWSPNGSMICTGSDDGDVRIWNSTTAECIYVLDDHSGWINDIEWSPSGDKILSCSTDKFALVYNVSNGEILYQTPTQPDLINSVCWHPNKDEFFTGSRDGRLTRWTNNTTTYSPTLIREEYDDFMAISCLEVSLNGKMIAVGNCELGGYGKIDIWNVEEGSSITELEGHSIRGLSWSPLNDYLLTCSGSDRTARIWINGTWEMERIFGNMEKLMVRWSLDDRTLLMASNSNELYKWNIDERTIETKYLPFSPIKQNGDEQKIDISYNSKMIASIVNNGSICIIDLTIDEPGGSFITLPYENKFEAIQWSPSSNLLAARYRNEIIIYDIAKMTIFNTIQTPGSFFMKRMEWNPNGSFLCIMSDFDNYPLIIYNVSTGNNIFNLTGFMGFPQSLSFSRDCRYLSALWSDWDSEAIYGISTWDLTDGRLIGNITVEYSYRSNIEWCPSGYILGVDSWNDESIKVLNPFTGEILVNLSREVNDLYYFSNFKWSHDGCSIAAFSMKDVNIWTFSDLDEDSFIDIIDVFPDDPTEWIDTDEDGVGDNSDIFPADPNEWMDTDEDGVGDNSDIFPDDPNEWMDTDGDGFGDNSDLFPEDPEDWIDSDLDGFGDNSDAFPNDPSEWNDTDEDGFGDNSDKFPDDPTEWNDSDKDGIGDNADLFPNDPLEWNDTDEDGVGDNTDIFPNDPLEWNDTDSDGYGDNSDIFGDNSDIFPDDPTEWNDSDEDGIGDNADAFPTDPLEWNDTDEDGVGDNADAYPLDPLKWNDTDDDNGVDDDTDTGENDGMKTSTIVIIVAVILLVLIVILVVVFLIMKGKPDNASVEETEEVVTESINDEIGQNPGNQDNLELNTDSIEQNEGISPEGFSVEPSQEDMYTDQTIESNIEIPTEPSFEGGVIPNETETPPESQFQQEDPRVEDGLDSSSEFMARQE